LDAWLRELRREINEGLNVVEQMERGHRLRVLRPSRRDGEQQARRPRDQHARAALDPELHDLDQHTDDPEGPGAAALARTADAARLRRPDAIDMGTREPVWAVRSGHEHQAGVAVIDMAAGDPVFIAKVNPLPADAVIAPATRAQSLNQSSH